MSNTVVIGSWPQKHAENRMVMAKTMKSKTTVADLEEK